jgi:hypothetical protein
VVCGSMPTEDQLFAAETVYVASASPKTDLKLLFGYLYRALLGFGMRVATDKVEDHALTVQGRSSAALPLASAARVDANGAMPVETKNG